jgi:hypothetical protein
MKKNVELKPTPLPKRVRRSNIEMMKFPPGSIKELKRISDEADLPLNRVFKDVIEAGLSVYADPETSPYQSLINFRKTLQQKRNNDDRLLQTGRGSTDPHVGNRALAASVDEASVGPGLTDGVREEATPERSGDVDEQPGLFQTPQDSDYVSVGLSPGEVSDSPSEDDSPPF